MRQGQAKSYGLSLNEESVPAAFDFDLLFSPPIKVDVI